MARAAAAIAIRAARPNQSAELGAFAISHGCLYHVRSNAANTMMAIDEIIENFELLDEWDDRYRYLIELGRVAAACRSAPALKPTRCAAAPARSGCQPHLEAERRGRTDLDFIGDSDAHIVRGLIAILFALYSGKPAREILVDRCPCHCSRSSACASISPRSARTAFAPWSSASCPMRAAPSRPRVDVQEFASCHGVYRRLINHFTKQYGTAKPSTAMTVPRFFHCGGL